LETIKTYKTAQIVVSYLVNFMISQTTHLIFQNYQ